MRQIAITDIAGFSIGQVEDAQGATGVTLIMCPSGMAAGMDVRGGGPASRDSRILDPLAAAETIHAVLLSGGSAFGLDAAGGVQRYLEERGIGLDLDGVKVPLVCQSGIFDLFVGLSDARPDAAMGYAAAQAAERGNYRDGNFGAGCGASVGKAAGFTGAMKTGIGSFAVQVGPLQMGALVVVNAFGDVRDPATGQVIAGALDVDGRTFLGSQDVLLKSFERSCVDEAELRSPENQASDLVANTTIGAILTNADLTKAQLCKVAAMGHDGMARAICPVHTSMDGDSLYALSVGGVSASADIVGTCAAYVVERAIVSAALAAQPAYGFPSANSIEAAAPSL